MLLRRHHILVNKPTPKKIVEVVDEVTYPNIDDITKKEISKLLEEKGIEHSMMVTKGELYKILIEG